jgi:hypothetical protein
MAVTVLQLVVRLVLAAVAARAALAEIFNLQIKVA